MYTAGHSSIIIVQDLGTIQMSMLPALVTGYGLYEFTRHIYEDQASPLRLLPSPKSQSLIFGDMKEIMAAVTNNLSFNLNARQADWAYCTLLGSCGDATGMG